GVVHRDVKPSNILLDRDGRPHLTDFGLARRDAGEVTLTMDGELLGTPAYISPEQARGQAHGVDGRSDVYSLGVVLYEMLTGERPFLGNREALLLQVLEDEPRPPRRLNHRLPRDLETVCLKCLQKAPRDRYATAGHLASDLRRFLAGEPVHARPLGFSGRSWRWCRRNPVVSGLIAAVIVAVATGFAGVTWQWRQTRQQWLRAESGLEQAEKNFRMAWKSVDEFFVIVSQNVQLRRDLPGLEQFRAELLGKALNAYKEFLQQHGNDHKLQVEVANAYFNVGVIASTIGPEQDASSAFRNAIRIRETLVRANPGVTSFQRDLALTYVRLGSLQRRNGQFDDAERSDTLAVEIIRALVAAHPDDTDARWLLAGSLIGLANLRGESEKPAEAEHTFAEAVDILKALVAARPDVSQFKATLATAYQNLGKLQRDAGQLENAERSLAQAVELLIPLVAAQPNEPEFAFVLGHVYTESGLLQFELGRHRDAAQYFGKSLEIRRALVAKHPDHHEYKQDLAGAYNNLARVQGVLGRDDESESSLVQSRDILSALVNAHPDVLEYKRELAGTCTNLGSLAQKAGRLERAERSYREALEHLTTLRALLPGSREIVRNLANTYNGLGSVQTATRRLADAESSFRQSRDLFETLLASDVHDLRTRQLMAESLGALGNVLWELGRHEEADAAFEQAVDHQKIAFHEAPPALLQFRQRLSAHYERLAWSRRLLNRPSEAVAASLERQKLWPESPVELYNVACQLAQCVLLVGRGPALATAAQQSERMRCVDLALEMLHRAIDAGWHDAAHTANDPDLKSLRGDARFQALISDLAFPADAFAR
ncbi:MAG TPA: tetratricopeptide repeat protein, partial [Isosphaeraceae bacterium]|nr:tetratricopeptide repeat protein [Isosphaeraceae bacterium]